MKKIRIITFLTSLVFVLAICEFVYYWTTDNFHLHPIFTTLVLIASFFLLLTALVAKIETRSFCFLFFHKWKIIKIQKRKDVSYGEPGLPFTRIHKKCIRCGKLKDKDRWD